MTGPRGERPSGSKNGGTLPRQCCLLAARSSMGRHGQSPQQKLCPSYHQSCDEQDAIRRTDGLPPSLSRARGSSSAIARIAVNSQARGGIEIMH